MSAAESGPLVIRASDVGLYLFCARAWRLKAEGYESANRAEMAAGAESHAAHGRQVSISRVAHRLSVVFIVLALIVVILMVATR